MSERIIVGPCLTRAQAARRAGVTQAEVRARPDLLRLGGRSLEETYFAFQFDHEGVRPDVGAVVLALKDRVTEARSPTGWCVPNRGSITSRRWHGSAAGVPSEPSGWQSAPPVPWSRAEMRSECLLGWRPG